jgi:general stress protein 26
VIAAQAPPSAVARLDSVARRIVDAAAYATFITVDHMAQPQARTVQPVAPDQRWEIWFATNPRTRKVQEIRKNPRVAVHYFDPVTQSYVSVSGRARLVRDSATIHAHWHPAWSEYYPDRDSSVVLVAVTPIRVEVVSSSAGVNSDARTWRPQSFVPNRRP